MAESQAGKAPSAPAGVMVPCRRHPETQTALRCSRCETPICPRCSVQTPVGARCRDCAQLKRVPTYDVGPLLLLRALGAALGAGLALGFAWYYLAISARFLFYLDLLLGAAVGYLVAEAATRAARLRRGPVMQAVACLGMVAAYLPQLFRGGFYPLDLLAVAIGLAVVIAHLR